jgi:hypothetical protein
MLSRFDKHTFSQMYLSVMSAVAILLYVSVVWEGDGQGMQLTWGGERRVQGFGGET